MTQPIAVLGTGGTIASTAQDGGAKPTEHVTELLRLSQSAGAVEVSVAEDVCSVLSPAMTPVEMWKVVVRAKELVASGRVSGVVVTHGTATLQETSYLADLTWPFEEPIVFTGSMRTGDQPDSDGPRNLRHALLVAGEPSCRGLGAVVVANEEVHSARDVRKTHKSAVQTFTSGQYGALGFIDNDTVYLHRSRTDRRVFDVTGLARDVPLVKAFSGMDDAFLRLALERRVDGVVVECFPGRGGLPPGLLPAVEELSRSGIPVVLSGAAEGRVFGTYGGPAGTRTFVEAGAMTAGDLFPVKARMLLMVLHAWAEGKVDRIRTALREVAP